MGKLRLRQQEHKPISLDSEPLHAPTPGCPPRHRPLVMHPPHRAMLPGPSPRGQRGSLRRGHTGVHSQQSWQDTHRWNGNHTRTLLKHSPSLSATRTREARPEGSGEETPCRSWYFLPWPRPECLKADRGAAGSSVEAGYSPNASRRPVLPLDGGGGAPVGLEDRSSEGPGQKG